MRALLVYPTHENCIEAERKYAETGIRAASYPARVTLDTGLVAPNCWNQEADLAESMGFSVKQAVCPTCRAQSECQRSGYLRQVKDAEQADVALCTHQRAAYSGLQELSTRRGYVSIHENPINLIRPQLEVGLPDLVQLKAVLDQMLNDPQFLDWFGDCLRVDDEGNRYEDQELAIRKERQLSFARLLSVEVDQLVIALQSALCTVEWHPQTQCKRPDGIERTLFFASRVAGVRFAGQPWRFVLSAVTGALSDAAIIVTKRYHKGGGQENYFLEKTVVGFRNNMPNPFSVTWFNDATTTVERLQGILGCRVDDRTPCGHLELQRKAVQIVRDVTRRTSQRTFLNIVRGVMIDRPEFQRVGLICHSLHFPLIKSLEPEFVRRITKFAYFGGGEDRSSNNWYERCDLILVLGTPRVPPSAMVGYLLQTGDVAAACAEPKWGTVYWEGRTESGEAVTVKTSGYYDPAWRNAQRDLVRAALVQAIGRGRGILETGCEVLVLSNEECGLLISDCGTESLNSAAAHVLAELERLTMENANRFILGNSIVSTSQIANATNLSTVRVRELLRSLERRGRVSKVGERGGWRPVFDSECPHQEGATGDGSRSALVARDPPGEP